MMLAAGAASRMGRCKALLPLPFPDGDCCALERLARMYAFCGQRFVVTGHHAGLLEPVALGWGLRAVRNPRPEDGMFSSICVGSRPFWNRPGRMAWSRSRAACSSILWTCP